MVFTIVVELLICGVVHQYEYRVVRIIVIVGIAHSHHRLLFIITTTADHRHFLIQPFPKIQLQIILGKPYICKVYLRVCIAFYHLQAVAHILL